MQRPFCRAGFSASRFTIGSGVQIGVYIVAHQDGHNLRVNTHFSHQHRRRCAYHLQFNFSTFGSRRNDTLKQSGTGVW
jgi:hypothetical protein